MSRKRIIRKRKRGKIQFGVNIETIVLGTRKAMGMDPAWHYILNHPREARKPWSRIS